MKSLKKLFIFHYNHIIRCITNNQDYSIYLNEKNYKLIDNFLIKINKEYSKSFGEQDLFNYLIFNFEYYTSLKTRFGKNEVKLNWLTGGKSIYRWKNRSDNWLFFNDKFIKKYNIQKIDKRGVDIEVKNFYKKLERRRFFNKEIGLLHCTELNLYDKYSRECLICNFKEICKKHYI